MRLMTGATAAVKLLSGMRRARRDPARRRSRTARERARALPHLIHPKRGSLTGLVPSEQRQAWGLLCSD